jgi:hypothetical protein
MYAIFKCCFDCDKIIFKSDLSECKEVFNALKGDFNSEESRSITMIEVN